jgi:hypothetical protein
MKPQGIEHDGWVGQQEAPRPSSETSGRLFPGALPVPTKSTSEAANLPPLTPQSDLGVNLAPLMWPLVAVVAIVALYLIARQAISSGSNVTITWKVTDKVAGRVVITKVRERATKNRLAA